MSKSPKKKSVQVAGRRSHQPQQGDDGGRGTADGELVSPITPKTVSGAGTGNQGDDGDPKHPGSKPYV